MPNTTLITRPEGGFVYALVGNPNCGKTTLFNGLTGLKQKVGNYPGVTVERKEGEFYSQHGEKIRVIDLPGSYSLNARSPDEAVFRDVLLGRRADTPRPDRIVCVLDASNLERNFYLVTQIMELGIPIILALNMVDMAEAKGIRIDVAKLSDRFGCPVIPLVANTKKGLLDLKLVMSRPDIPAPKPFLDAIPIPLRSALMRCRDRLAAAGVVNESVSLLEPLYLLSDHDPSAHGSVQPHLEEIKLAREQVEREIPCWEDQLVAARYDVIRTACAGAVHHPENEKQSFTDRVDGILLHRVWGWVSLIVALTALFYLIFSVAEAPMNWIEQAFSSLGEKFTGSTDPATGVTSPGWMQEGDLRDLIVDGALAGVQGVIIFLPQILILFFFIGLMEDTGYMARVAFIMDRFMGKVGLNGKSFLPFLSSYACAVPGVMAARTIDNPKDRLITILIAPLASCSARLPVYLLLISALVPTSEVPLGTKAIVMVSMYALGTLGAFGFAWLFNSRLLPGKPSPLILELPSYKRPSLLNIFQQMRNRAWMFVRRAGTVILGLSILLWAASTYPKSEGTKSEQLAHSAAGRLGHFIEPVIKPLGYDWKIGIGLIGSFAAREIFVSTMSTVYSIEEEDDTDQTKLRDQLRAATWPDGTRVYTPAVCLGLMVFYVFAMQCLSTVAVVRRETGGWKWPLFQLGYMTGTAYILAFFVYQIGRFMGY